MRIGVLFGMEESFPPAFVERINGMGIPDVTAEFVQVGAVRMDEPSRYRVIVDRISHDIPFYRAYLKNAVLAGTTVINNPFWWSADDKFFNYALATRLGVAIPPTVILPHKDASAGHDRPVDAQPALSARLGSRLRVRRAFRRSSSRSTAAAGGTSIGSARPRSSSRAYDNTGHK